MSSATRINPSLQLTTGGILAAVTAALIIVAMMIVLTDDRASDVPDVPAQVPGGDVGQSGSISGSAAPALSIPDDDPAGVAHAMTSDHDEIVAAVEVEIVVDHPYPQDLRAELTSPSGTVAELFDSTASIPERIDASIAPGLAAFVGESTRGDWTLHVVDTASADEGELQSWGITIVTQ